MILIRCYYLVSLFANHKLFLLNTLGKFLWHDGGDLLFINCLYFWTRLVCCVFWPDFRCWTHLKAGLFKHIFNLVCCLLEFFRDISPQNKQNNWKTVFLLFFSASQHPKAGWLSEGVTQLFFCWPSTPTSHF